MGVCEISLESCNQAVLQTYSAILFPKLFVKCEWASYVMHASVIVGCMNIGKTLALDLDFYGKNRPQYATGDKVQCFIWAGAEKSKERVLAEITRVMDYGYEITLAASVGYTADVRLLNVELCGGRGKPVTVERLKGEVASKESKAGIGPGHILAEIAEQSVFPYTDRTFKRPQIECLSTEKVRELGGDKIVTVTFWEMQEIPHKWAEEKYMDKFSKVSTARIAIRVAFRTSEVMTSVLTFSYFGALWRDANLGAHTNGNLALPGVLVCNVVACYIMVRFIAKSTSHTCVFALLFTVVGPPLIFTQFGRMQYVYYGFRVAQVIAIVCVLYVRHSTESLEERFFADSAFAYAAVLGTATFFALIPLELLMQWWTSPAACVSNEEIAPLAEEGGFEAQVKHARMHAPALVAALEDDDPTVVRLLACVQLVDDFRVFYKIARGGGCANSFNALAEALGHSFWASGGYTAATRGTAVSQDGKRFVVTSNSGTIRVYDSETCQQDLELQSDGKPVIEARFFPDSRRLVTVGDDSFANIWDVTTGDLLHKIEVGNFFVRGVAVAPDGKHMLTVSKDGRAAVWDTETGKEEVTLHGHCEEADGACYFPDGRRVATASKDGTARVWDSISGKELLCVRPGGDVRCVAAFPDGSRIVASGTKGTSVWDASTGEELKLFGKFPSCETNSEIIAIEFFPDGRRAAFAGAHLSVMNMETGVEEFQCDVNRQLWRLAIFPDGKRILSSGQAPPLACITDLTVETSRGGL
eukprot:NODE_1040_length_2640_cov_7.209312.p1 GENE.NODE_1040_length_2640_cov_7.209312~~NODE_1040_length_2640_cov_7.209312.p1  ORF type:complete len:756 (+),score=155.91 NODE_1040_length_2640_cov_7.209312:3-2270(+)